jgi:pimeloyl-ACP methyl ester carboxylesterase
MMRSMLRSLLLAITVPVWVAAAIANQSSPTKPHNSLKHLVEVGNHRLNFVCTGNGSPTVVFMQGLTADITSWRSVRVPVSAITTTCVYDRAGYGFSDPAIEPATAESVTNGLHELLNKAGIKGRVVLVGHSLGGLFATYYVDRFKESVAGLVLIDPSFAGQYDSFNLVNRKDMATMHAADLAWKSQMRDCESLAKNGKLSVSVTHDCFQLPTGLGADDLSYAIQQFVRPAYYAAILAETSAFDSKWTGSKFKDGIDGDQERRSIRPWGDVPVEVLSASNSFQNPTVTNSSNKIMEANWVKGHAALARRSTNGHSVLVPNSHHSIQVDQPSAVIEAIRAVVLAARRTDGLR